MRQILNTWYARSTRKIYTDNTLATPASNGVSLYQNNTSYTLIANVYSTATNTSGYDCSTLVDYEFAIGNYQDTLLLSNNSSINVVGDGSNVGAGSITIRINATSTTLSAELGSAEYKNLQGELRANVSSDKITLAMIPITVRNTVL